MTHWFDCPICIGYCELDPEDGENTCEWCGAEVWFQPAPKALRDELYNAGIWVEEIVCLEDDGMVVSNPAFAREAEYQEWIESNVTRIRAACDQLTSLLDDDEEE